MSGLKDRGNKKESILFEGVRGPVGCRTDERTRQVRQTLRVGGVSWSERESYETQGRKIVVEFL